MVKVKTHKLKEGIPVPVPYNKNGEAIARNIKNSWRSIVCDPNVLNWVPNPFTTYQGDKKLQEFLVHSKQT